jgi:hypothetical protein
VTDAARGMRLEDWGMVDSYEKVFNDVDCRLSALRERIKGNMEQVTLLPYDGLRVKMSRPNHHLAVKS